MPKKLQKLGKMSSQGLCSGKWKTQYVTFGVMLRSFAEFFACCHSPIEGNLSMRRNKKIILREKTPFPSPISHDIFGILWFSGFHFIFLLRYMITHVSHARLLVAWAGMHVAIFVRLPKIKCIKDELYAHSTVARRWRHARECEQLSKQACDVWVIMYLNKKMKWNPETNKIPNISTLEKLYEFFCSLIS